MMNKLLIFTDLDGTLWSFDEKVSKSTKNAIKQVQACGHKVFSNTGRSCCEVPAQLFELGLDGYVFSAGSHICYKDENILYEPLTKEDLKAFYEEFKDRGIGFSFEGANRTFVYETSDQLFAPLANQLGLVSFPSLHEMTEDDANQIMKVTIHCTKEIDVEPFLKACSGRFTFTPLRIPHDPIKFAGEFTLAHHTKGTAIRFLQDQFPDFETMAFGDSENDFEMFKAATYPVAMNNACAPLKDLACYITTSVDEDGIVHALEHFGVIEKAN